MEKFLSYSLFPAKNSMPFIKSIYFQKPYMSTQQFPVILLFT